MSSTKRAFLNAGAIVSIVLAAICILGGVLICASANLVTEKSMKDILKNDTSYHLVETTAEDSELKEGDYYFTYTENGKLQKLTKADIVEVASLTKTVMNAIGWYSMLLSVANIVVAVLVMKTASKNSNKKASIIALLVLSVLSGNLLTMAFMIVGLCLKNKPEVVIESGETTQQ